MFTKSIMLVALFLSLAGSAHAGSYIDAMKACGAKWRASEERKHVEKGQGTVEWNKYRKTCTAEIGWDRASKTK